MITPSETINRVQAVVARLTGLPLAVGHAANISKGLEHEASGGQPLARGDYSGPDCLVWINWHEYDGQLEPEVIKQRLKIHGNRIRGSLGPIKPQSNRYKATSFAVGAALTTMDGLDPKGRPIPPLMAFAIVYFLKPW